MDLAAKIALLVEERGWNQEDFARIANLNRHTVRVILKNSSDRRLRNATVKQCAEALGLEVNELRDLPLERLLPRMHGQRHADVESLKLLQEKATDPELMAWVRDHPDRAASLSVTEAEELIVLHGSNSHRSNMSVDRQVDFIERKRRILQEVGQIAATEYFSFLEQFVHLLHEKIHVPHPRS